MYELVLYNKGVTVSSKTLEYSDPEAVKCANCAAEYRLHYSQNETHRIGRLREMVRAQQAKVSTAHPHHFSRLLAFSR